MDYQKKNNNKTTFPNNKSLKGQFDSINKSSPNESIEIAEMIIKRKNNNKTTFPNNKSLKGQFDSINKSSPNESIENKIKQHQPKSDIKTMIIDDEPDIIETYKVILQKFNKEFDEKPYIINTFTSSIDAAKHFLELNRNYKSSSPYYDLIIIDIKLPDINGIQLYRMLKIIDTNIKTLFISALDAAKDLEGILPGIKSKDIIKKPFDIEEFYLKVKQIINF